MALVKQAADRWKDLICPLCKELFWNPVILDCGHNFCWGCIDGVWSKGNEPCCYCPECGEAIANRKCIANRTLGKMAEKAKGMDPIAGVWGSGRPTVPGTCCVSSCEEQPIQVQIQMCPRHWSSFASAMEPHFYPSKGGGERPPVPGTGNGGSIAEPCSVPRRSIPSMEKPLDLRKTQGNKRKVPGPGDSSDIEQGGSDSGPSSVSRSSITTMEERKKRLKVAGSGDGGTGEEQSDSKRSSGLDRQHGANHLPQRGSPKGTSGSWFQELWKLIW